MPEQTRRTATATDQVDVPTPLDDAVTPASEGELSAVVVPEAPTEVDLTTDPEAASAAVLTAPVEAPIKGKKKAKRALGPFFWLAVAFMVVLVTLAVLADVLPFVDDPDQRFADQLSRNEDGRLIAGGPSPDHWFGVDGRARDLFSRVVYGARVSLIVGFVSVGIGMLVGGGLGVIAGYFRGRVDTVITALANILLAFPPLILALALVSFLGQNLNNVILAVTILAIPSLIRITRAATLTFSQREFVVAARTLGASHWRVITREVLPNVIPPMASFSLLAIAIVIVAEGALSFLGLSVEAPTPSWGKLIQEGRQNLDEFAHASLIPCAVMFVTLLSLNYIGDKLRALFNVREAGI